MKVEIKDGKTIVDCENTNGVIYPPNKCVGVVSFINCKNIVGVEFDIATKIFELDTSNLPQLKYINIQHTKVKELCVKDRCMVYCKNDVVIKRF